MKKQFAFLALFLAFCLFSTAQAAEENLAELSASSASNPVDELTGKIWMESSQDNKQAYLLGVDSVIAIDIIVHQRRTAKFAETRKQKSDKNHGPRLSGFVAAWTTAFKDTTRAQLVKLIDDWYTAHPQDLNRPVMNVIWHEIILPRVKDLVPEKTGK